MLLQEYHFLGMTRKSYLHIEEAEYVLITLCNLTNSSSLCHQAVRVITIKYPSDRYSFHNGAVYGTGTTRDGKKNAF